MKTGVTELVVFFCLCWSFSVLVCFCLDKLDWNEEKKMAWKMLRILTFFNQSLAQESATSWMLLLVIDEGDEGMNWNASWDLNLAL
jgi:hypothetical protein